MQAGPTQLHAGTCRSIDLPCRLDLLSYLQVDYVHAPVYRDSEDLGYMQFNILFSRACTCSTHTRLKWLSYAHVYVQLNDVHAVHLRRHLPE